MNALALVAAITVAAAVPWFALWTYRRWAPKHPPILIEKQPAALQRICPVELSDGAEASYCLRGRNAPAETALQITAGCRTEGAPSKELAVSPIDVSSAINAP